jgi:histidinol phosphatase-like PHP family hydrolase
MTHIYDQCDFHVHTHLSPCARPDMKLRAIVDACADRGISYLGIMDHMAVGTDARILAQTRREMRSIKSPVRVFVGCEADILDVGRHVVTDKMKSELDYIGVSANHFHVRSVAQPEDESPAALSRHFLRMFRYACSLDFADFVAHPLFVFQGTYDPTFLESLTDDELFEALAEAKTNNIAMEISPRALHPEQLYFKMRFLHLCRQAGLKFAIGSDAHRLEAVGMTRVLARVVDELQLTDDDIWLPRGVG